MDRVGEAGTSGMTIDRVERRLAAILAADVAGYSRLMGADEEGTLARLTAHRRELFDPAIAKHRGRIVKTTGDGLLAEFASVVDAVRCAAEVQAGMAERNSAASPRIDFRIGINVGDIVMQDDDIFGDGVNIAARLEGIADPGGICVSQRVQEDAAGKTGMTFEDMGEQALKNIARPVRAYRVRWDGAPTTRSAEPLTARAGQAVCRGPAVRQHERRPGAGIFRRRPRRGPDHQPVQDAGLLRHRPQFHLRLQGQVGRHPQVAKELGVRYVLEGSVRRAANRVRITGQLIDGTTGNHVWAEKFEGSFEDIFDLQDRLTESIVGALEPTLRRAEIERARSKRPETLDAYDFYLRALPHAYDNTVAENDEAIRLLDEALRLDPNYAVAHAHASWCHEQRWFRGGFNPDDREAALRHAALALSLGADDPQALSIAAFVHANITHEYDGPIRTLDRALEMNPNSALAYGFSAIVLGIDERYDEAIEHAQKALRLSPSDPLNYHPHFVLAYVHLFTSRFEEGAHYATLTIQTKPSFSVPYLILIASLVNLDRLDAARAAAARLLSLVPDFAIAGFLRADYWRRERMGMIADALRRAGLPE